MSCWWITIFLFKHWIFISLGMFVIGFILLGFVGIPLSKVNTIMKLYLKKCPQSVLIIDDFERRISFEEKMMLLTKSYIKEYIRLNKNILKLKYQAIALAGKHKIIIMINAKKAVVKIDRKRYVIKKYCPDSLQLHEQMADIINNAVKNEVMLYEEYYKMDI